jgi:hypothetical protein
MTITVDYTEHLGDHGLAKVVIFAFRDYIHVSTRPNPPLLPDALNVITSGRRRTRTAAATGHGGKRSGPHRPSTAPVPVCPVTSACVMVHTTLSKIDEGDVAHGAKDHSHAGRRSDW